MTRVGRTQDEAYVGFRPFERALGGIIPGSPGRRAARLMRFLKRAQARWAMTALQVLLPFMLMAGTQATPALAPGLQAKVSLKVETGLLKDILPKIEKAT